MAAADGIKSFRRPSLVPRRPYCRNTALRHLRYESCTAWAEAAAVKGAPPGPGEETSNPARPKTSSSVLIAIPGSDSRLRPTLIYPKLIYESATSTAEASLRFRWAELPPPI